MAKKSIWITGSKTRGVAKWCFVNKLYKPSEQLVRSFQFYSNYLDFYSVPNYIETGAIIGDEDP